MNDSENVVTSHKNCSSHKNLSEKNWTTFNDRENILCSKTLLKSINLLYALIKRKKIRILNNHGLPIIEKNMIYQFIYIWWNQSWIKYNLL